MCKVVVRQTKWLLLLVKTMYNNFLFLILLFVFTYKMCLKIQYKYNKRAQRALGRSPEEKVKGQGEAIYRGPLMLSTKYW